MKLEFRVWDKKSVNGPGTLFKFDTEEGGLTLGRESGQLLIPDQRVSKQHLYIFKIENEQLGMIDLGSRNGTYLNGEKVERAELKVGDKIKLGDTLVIVVAIDGEKSKSVYDLTSEDPLVLHHWPQVMGAVPQIKR